MISFKFNGYLKEFTVSDQYCNNIANGDDEELLDGLLDGLNIILTYRYGFKMKAMKTKTLK